VISTGVPNTAVVLLALLAAEALEGLLGVPAALLREAGLILVPYVAFVAYIGTRACPPVPAVRAIIACNALWAAASIVLLTSGWIAPFALGYAFVMGQAFAVALFGVLQYAGLRRLPAA
jgi:hypothetical protein